MIRIAGLWITMLGIGCLTPFEAQPQETPASVVARIGTDPEALARFVYEDISLEPVAGIMRTAETVLSHGGGGPAEREALLAEILALAGHEVRLLTAESSGESALARLATIGASQIIAQEVPAIQKIREEAIYVHDRLLAAVYEAGALPPLAETCACPPSEALTQHVWTEVRTDTGWRPLDPDLPAELVAAGRVVTAEALSHTVGLTLRLGYADGSEIEALSAEAPAKRLARDVVGLLQEASDGALRLILLLGDQVVESAPVPISTVSQPAGGLLGSSAGVFGGLSDLNTTIGGSDPDPEADPVRLILEWRLNGPGQSVSGRYLVWSTEAEGTHTDLSRALSTTLGLTVTNGVPHGGAAVAQAVPADPEAPEAAHRWLALLGAVWQIARDEFPASPQGLPVARAVTAPGLVIARASVRGKEERIELSLDLTHRAVRIWAAEPEMVTPEQLFLHRVYNGVLDVVVERAVLNDDHWSGDAASLVAATDTLAVPLEIYPVAPLPPDTPTELRGAVDSGQIVVVPRLMPQGWEDLPLAWWMVDPTTGQVRDMNALGYHQSDFMAKIANIGAALQTRLGSLSCACVVTLSTFSPLLKIMGHEDIAKALDGARSGVSKVCEVTGRRKRPGQRTFTSGKGPDRLLPPGPS